MALTPEQERLIDELYAQYSGNPRAGLVEAFVAGMLDGSARFAVQMAANMQQNKPNAGADADFLESEEADNTLLSAADSEALIRLGIDPKKSFRQRNTVFTVCGYRPSRWKYPISVVTQTGARYKMTVVQVIRLQKAS